MLHLPFLCLLLRDKTHSLLLVVDKSRKFLCLHLQAKMLSLQLLVDKSLCLFLLAKTVSPVVPSLCLCLLNLTLVKIPALNLEHQSTLQNQFQTHLLENEIVDEKNGP